MKYVLEFKPAIFKDRPYALSVHFDSGHSDLVEIYATEAEAMAEINETVERRKRNAELEKQHRVICEVEIP